MRLSHYLMFSVSTQTQSAALASMPLSFEVLGLNQLILSKWETCFSTRYDFYLLGRTNEMLQSLDVFDEVVDSKTLDFFTSTDDSDGEPRTTLQSQAEL